jgi:hypothetical protein
MTWLRNTAVSYHGTISIMVLTNYMLHADIKPDNILSVEVKFKLADLGFAKFIKMTNKGGKDLKQLCLEVMKHMVRQLNSLRKLLSDRYPDSSCAGPPERLLGGTKPFLSHIST